MRKYGPFLAIALLLLVNIVVLTGVARNRSGEPDAVMELTERELPLSTHQISGRQENTGIALKLDWNQYAFSVKSMGRAGRDRMHDWFDKTKLEEIGFDCSLPPGDPNADLHYHKMLPKKGFVVLEFEGKAWDAWRENARMNLLDAIERAKAGRTPEKDIKEAKGVYENEMKTRSRLFAIDAGRDPLQLRQRYPDRSRFIIAAAQIRLQYTRPHDNENRNGELPKLAGAISEILIDNIHVPRGARTELDGSVAKSGSHEGPSFPYGYREERAPTYTVMLSYGKRFEPWVAGIKPLIP